MKKINIIGGGISGLASALYLRSAGYDVSVFDRRQKLGGVANQYTENGFTFDTGPTWYLMPDVFEKFFSHFGIKPGIDFKLMEPDPSYRIYYDGRSRYDIRKNPQKNLELFESLEPGAGDKLKEYLADSRYKYNTAIAEFLYREYKNIFQFFNRKMLTEGIRLHVLKKLDNHIRRYFKNDALIKILEYNIVFLGTAPRTAPALYSLMSHVDMNMGVYFPEGGIYTIIRAMEKKAREMGVKFYSGAEVTRINTENHSAVSIEADGKIYENDILLSSIDYPYLESMLDKKNRNYSTAYWKKKLYAPTAFLVFAGLRNKIPGILHHNIYTPENWDVHFHSIFNCPTWPENPAYYFAAPCKSDPSLCPENKDSLFILVPVAPDMDDTSERRENLKKKIYAHLSRLINYDIEGNLEFDKVVAHREFIDNHYFRGTSLGMAHSLFQSAAFRPAHRNKKIKNLFYTGHYTHPGIGMPMVTISAEIVAGIIREEFPCEKK